MNAFTFGEKINKTVFSKNINFIALIYSSSELSEELSKSSTICLITFFLMYLHAFKNSLWIIVSIFIRAESKFIIAKQV